MLQDTTDRNTSIPMSAHDRSSPHRGLVSAPDGCNIAHGKDRSGSRFGGFSKFSQKKFPARIFVVARQQRAVPLYAEKFFGIQKVLALRGWVAFPSHAT